MIEVGKKHQLEVIRETGYGIYLNQAGSLEPDILLPIKQVPDGTQVGDIIEVFVYRDSKDRKIATVNTPKLMLGEVGRLRVVSVNTIGAFLNWGLERDLFMPFREQTQRIYTGEAHVVRVYVDKSDRLCATMKIYDGLRCDSPYVLGDQVKGIIYEIKPAFGAFVALEGGYHGMIPMRELFGKYKVGEELECRVCKVREDGKLEVTPRAMVHVQMEDDAKVIMDKLEAAGGSLPLHDKSDPELIKDQLGMSKAAFKRAIGRLMKEGAIEIGTNGIKRNW